MNRPRSGLRWMNSPHNASSRGICCRKSSYLALAGLLWCLGFCRAQDEVIENLREDTVSQEDMANPVTGLYDSRATLLQWSYGTSFGGGAPLDEPLHSDRPDFTETSTTVGRGVTQLEMGYTYRQDANDGERTHSHRYPEMLCRVGVMADWLELRLAWNYAHEPGVPAQPLPGQHGAEDLYVGAKVALTPQESILPEIAVTPQMLVPTGADEFTAGEVLPGINWLYGWDITDRLSFAGSSQCNRALDEETDAPFLLLAQSFTVGISLSEHLGNYYEWFVLVPDGADSQSTEHYFNGGFTIPVTLNLQLDVRAGIGLNDAAENFFAGAGAVVRL